MAALLNVKQFVRFDEHGNLHVPNKLFVACQAYVQTPLLNDNSSRVATTEWVRAQLTNITGVSFSETDPIWASDKTYYYTKLQSDARYLQSFTETDPTVPAWAKASVKPTYTFAELLSKPTTIAGYGITDIPTTLPASDVYAWAKAATKPSYAYSEITGLPTLFSGSYADLTNKPTLFSGAYTDLTGKPTLFSGAYADLTGKPTIPTNNNELTNGAGYLTSYTETDPIWTAEKTNYALKTYVDTSISDLVASAPATLNTLNELALALGSDANFATTVSTSIGNRVPYTGATADVDLGSFVLSAGATSSNIVYANGSGSSSGILYLKQGTISANFTGYNGIYATSTSYGFIADAGASYKLGIFSLASLTNNTARTFTLPDLSGTLALLEGTQTFSGLKRFDLGLLLIEGATPSAVGYTGLTGDANGLVITKRVGSTGYTNLLSFTSATSNTYTYPNASGTLALTSQIPSTTGLVPYTGATSNVDLGIYNLTSNALKVDGTVAAGGCLNIKQNNSTGATGVGYNSIGARSANSLLIYYGGATSSDHKSVLLNVTNLTNTSTRTFEFPDASGTIALTSNLSSYVPTSRTITINGTALDLSADRAWTITTASAYTLPTASASVLGGIKVGTNLSIDANGVLSSTDTNTTYSAFTGATASANGTAGLVIAPLVANRGQYLRGDGTWATPPDTDTDTNTVTQIRRENADGTTSATAYRTGDIRLRQGTNVTITEVAAGVFQISSSYVDTDTNTWDANSKTVAGYVAAPGAVANQVWKTDANGNPGWRNDADTDTNTTYTAGTGLTLSGTTFSVTKTITAAQTADTIALRNGDGQLVATGFYQASSRSLKTNISPFTKSALDIIRDVTVVSFNYKTDIINKHVGFIAEDTPEELSTRHKNVMDSNNTIGVLLKAVQELEARIKQLESK
jgi:hypothetical protein